jgi:toxin ParE1/3/4
MYRVLVSRKAQAQLESTYRYIAKASFPRIAESYVEAIRAECQTLAHLPKRGTDHESITPGLRTMGFRRSATIAFRVSEDTVTIVGIFYRGLNVRAKLDQPRRSK